MSAYPVINMIATGIYNTAPESKVRSDSKQSAADLRLLDGAGDL